MSNEIEAATMCFACGKDNPIGLRIQFHFDGEDCTAEFTPDENHVGWQKPMDLAAVADKFLGCADYADWPEPTARQVIETVGRMEELPDMGALTALLAK